jgi:hypothetical protein
MDRSELPTLREIAADKAVDQDWNTFGPEIDRDNEMLRLDVPLDSWLGDL